MTAAGAGTLHRSVPPGDPDILAAFSAALTKLGSFEAAPRLAVAVSGGPDSLALVFLAVEWCRARNGEVIALTVDHKLRPESEREAAQVATWMADYGIAHHILDWEGPKPATGIQDAARQARYQLLTAWCRTQGILHLLLGHHADDQAETVVFRNNRHSGPDGLAGMAALVELPQLRLLRPLLNLRRDTLRRDLQQRGQDFLTDPSNNNPRFTRARLRKTMDETARLDAITLSL
jgi:tRNA(Ile)-lysidine synthase